MLVYLSVCLVVLFGFVGLTVDIGRMELRTMQLQAAADDAALTAATEFQRGNASWQTFTQTEVTSFLAANSAPTATAAFQMAPAGSYSNDQAAVQVTLTQSFPVYFLGVLSGSKTTTLTAKGAGLIPPCTFFTGTSGYSLQETSASLHSTCPIYVQTGLQTDSGSSLSTGQVKVTGSSGQSSAQGTTTYPILYRQSVINDPLSYITAPVFSSCSLTGASISNSTATAYPGTYCGGMTAYNSTITLTPGLYIITGGVSIQSSTINGTGVTFYFTQGGGYGFGTFSVTANSTLNLTAPTSAASGGIPGVIFFGDRSWSGGATDFQFDSSTFNGDGIFYVNGTGISVNNTNMTTSHYLGFVTKTLVSSYSNLYPAANYSTLGGGNPFHLSATLVQ